MVFAKLQTWVRKFKLRKVDELWKKLGELCDGFTPKETAMTSTTQDTKKIETSKLVRNTL